MGCTMSIASVTVGRYDVKCPCCGRRPVTTPVVMPQLGLEVNEGIVTAVLVEIGAEGRQGQPLMELETDKAITEVVAPCDGVVSTIEVEQGQTVAVGATLIKLAQTTDE